MLVTSSLPKHSYVRIKCIVANLTRRTKGKVQGFEITPESDWPAQYHVAMTQGCEVARVQPVEEVDLCLEVCHHAVEAAVSRSTLEKAHRQLLEDRYVTSASFLLHYLSLIALLMY